MFTKLKIYTGITIIIGCFSLTLLATTGYSVFNTMANNRNFNRIIIAGENNNEIRDAAYNINSTRARLNAMLLHANSGNTITPEMIAGTQNVLALAQERMHTFMSTPFNSEEGRKAAGEVQVAFKRLENEMIAKLKVISQPSAATIDIEAELVNSGQLREKIDAYSAISDAVSQSIIDDAQRDYQRMVGVGVVVIIGAIIMMVAVRIWLKRTLVKRLDETVSSLQTIAAGDLSQKIDVGAQNEIGLMLNELEGMRHSLTSTITGIREGVHGIQINSHEIANGNNDLSARTEEQASALQETAASMEQIKTTVRQNADNAHTARQLAESASTNALNGGEAMENLELIMEQIAVSSRQIADINGVIDSIANQTNILALNAAVEAARAGEQGRGFAVVAEEVRNLAKRSAEAAKEINGLINTSVATTDTGSRQVTQASAIMKDIVGSVTHVTEIMGEITSASDEQSAGINQISQAVNEMDLVTQQNSAMVEEAAAAAGQLVMQSNELEKLVAQFVLNETGDKTKTVIARRPSLQNYQPSSGGADNAQWETF